MQIAQSPPFPVGISYFRLLAQYNSWANKRLYLACRELPVEIYMKDFNLYFGSIHRTLNHILVADRLLMGRYKGFPATIQALDSIPCATLNDLRIIRQNEDDAILSFFNDHAEIIGNEILSYIDTEGHERSVPQLLAYAHFFNHQTHHRGQVHAALTQSGIKEPPPLDIIYFYYEGGWVQNP